MSKELTPLEALESIKNLFFGSSIDLSKQFDIIETALKDYERRLELAKEYKDVNNVAKRLLALEIIKELILTDLVFDDEEQAINFSFGISTLCIKIEDKTKYDLLKEVLL